MTTEAQKQAETRYVTMFLDGLVEYVSIEPCEPPDFWVRRSPSVDLALEVVEYHPAAETFPGIRRTQIEATWWKNLHPLIIPKCTSIKDVSVHLRLNENRLPKKNECEVIAADLVRLVEVVVKNAAFRNADTLVEFGPKASLPANCPGEVFLPVEDWKVATTLSSLNVSRHPSVPVPLWHCLNANTAWLGPDVEEFSRILESKRKKAQKYNLGGAPLWLLVVCATDGDLQSHIFPQNAEECERLADAVKQTGFDFTDGPFEQIWLLSAIGEGRVRLHPAQV
jgi:hypothetical protein